MKRSKMQSLVANMIRLYRLDNVEDMEAADRLLKVLEQEGMLPPPSGIDPVTSSLLYCYYPKVVEKKDNGMWFFDRDSSILWELEDEEK